MERFMINLYISLTKSLSESKEKNKRVIHVELLREALMQRLKNLKVSSISKLIEENYKRKSSDIWTEFLYVDFRKKQRKDLVNELYKTTLLKNYLPFLIIFKTAILLPLNLTEIKYKRILPTDEPLKERGENALDILALTQLRENKLPDRIEYALETYFNGRGYFKERNFYFYDLNTRTEFSKEHLPEGMLKLIVILTALERNPAILMIDEVENSLHPELLEFLVEVLKESEGSVFLTTHSPVVLNLVEPEDVLIFKPTTEGVEIRNLTEFKSKEDLLKELEELGINLSDKVFFGLT
ncbi:AAA family ATPase [Archaeoglobus sp.]|uniref:AAA family ATPase n=1 Tax=Archaeoglobus sp. TaxID=1872626 RepID=UPI00338FD5C2